MRVAGDDRRLGGEDGEGEREGARDQAGWLAPLYTDDSGHREIRPDDRKI